jgi:hypothetical protein
VAIQKVARKLPFLNQLLAILPGPKKHSNEPQK